MMSNNNQYTEGEDFAQNIADFIYLMALKVTWRTTIAAVDGFFGGEHFDLVESVHEDLLAMQLIAPHPWDPGFFHRVDHGATKIIFKMDWYLPLMSDKTRALALKSKWQSVGAYTRAA